MDRLACVDLPAFALQQLLRRHPEWKGEPVAVVTRPTLQGEVLEACKRARGGGVTAGMTLAAALGLVPELRVEGVMEISVEEALAAAEKSLRRFSPHVEPSRNAPGVFWLDASGLSRLYESPAAWARAIRDELLGVGFIATVIVGYGRFGTYALARASRGIGIVRDSRHEVTLARQVRLDRLGLRLKELRQLAKLGCATVGDLVDLPSSGLLFRFGAEVHKLRAWASGELFCPLVDQPVEEPVIERIELDEAETSSMRLTFLVKRMLGPLLRRAADRHSAVYELEIRLALDHAAELTERLEPAEPTLDEAQLIDLVRLRFERIAFRAGAVAVEIEAHCVRATQRQLELFAKKPKRDPAAAQRVFARLRAEFGAMAVVRAELADNHLPETRFVWAPFPASAPPVAVAHGGSQSIVRRIYARPIPLVGRPVCGPRGCHLGGMDQPPFSDLRGPFVVSGGWWGGEEVHREYHFAESESGELLWIFFDRCRRRWFAQGEVS